MAKLAVLANRHSDMEEKELDELFSKRLEVFSNFWLFLIAFYVGFISPFATGLLHLASLASIVFPLSLTFFGFVLLLLIIGIILLTVLVYYVSYGVNPFRVQERLLKDYLEARKIIRDRAKPKSPLE